MSARLVYLKLELKRVCKKLPHIITRATVLLLLAGTIAFLVSKMLYGRQVSGRITVGAVLPEGDAVTGKAVAMVSSLESVKSICDFECVDCEEGMARPRAGKLFGIIEMPEGLVQDIVNGINTPVCIMLPKGAGLESRIFKELTDAGSRMLEASQAGIYANNELYVLGEMADSIPRLEADLNRIFMGYSLPRTDYFKNIRVMATGDMDTYRFYGISVSVLSFLLCAILMSAYLSSAGRTMRQGLSLIDAGNATVTGTRILGLSLLMGVTALLTLAAAWGLSWITWSLPGILSAVAVYVAASPMVVFLYQAAGSLMRGVMLLFLAATAIHLLAGGFLPLVSLLASLQTATAFLPTYIFMGGVKIAVISTFSIVVSYKLAAVAVACFLFSPWVEVGRG